MHQEEQVRQLLADAADELGPTPDLTPGALRQGKRSVRLGRVRTGAITAAAAVAVLTPAALVAPWWSGATDAASQYSVSMPLHPTSWPTGGVLAPPTTAYPVVHVTPTDDSDRPELTNEQREVQYAYKQKAAEVLQQLLPPALGEMRVPDDDVNALQIGTEKATYPITLRADPAGEGLGTTDCTGKPDCLNGRLSDGTLVAVSGNTSPASLPTAFFLYKGHFIIFGVFLPEGSTTEPPLTPEQLLRTVTDAKFVELLDFRIANPVLMDDGYSVRNTTAPADAPSTD